MKNTNLAEFREYLGSRHFQGESFLPMAQFIYQYVFKDTPEESQLELFEDFIINFWTDIMPETNRIYQTKLEPIEKKTMDEIAARIQSDLREKFYNLSIIQRLTDKKYAKEVFRMIKDMNQEDATFAIYILLVSERYTPYRFVEVETVLNEREILEPTDEIQEAWITALNFTRLFPEGESIPNTLRMWKMIEDSSDEKKRVILMYLFAAATVYLTREYKLEMSIDRDRDLPVVKGFEEKHPEFLTDCLDSIKQSRCGNRKFRNFLDQAAHLLSAIKQFDSNERPIALFFALSFFCTLANSGQEYLPAGNFFNQSIN